MRRTWERGVAFAKETLSPRALFQSLVRSAVVAGSLGLVGTVVGTVLSLPAVTIIGLVVSVSFFVVALVFWLRGRRHQEPVAHSHSRLPMPGIVEREQRRAQAQPSGMEIKYPSGGQDAIAMPGTVHIGAEATQKAHERRDQIRTRLAELILDGDQAWNAASVAYQIWQQNQLRQARQQSVPALPQGEPVPIPEWWKAVQEWLNEVEDYLAATPEFGESEAALFRAQEAALEPISQGKAPLSTEVQTQRTMKLIRLKQDKLRGLRENL